MAVITTGSEYEQHFDAENYLDLVYSPTSKYRYVIEFVLDQLQKAFVDSEIKGNNLLDVGSGPTIHSIISASNNVDNIYLSDYADKNIEILKKWLIGERSLQEDMVQYVCDLENKGPSVADRVSQLRLKVKDIVHIDILSPDPLQGSDLPTQYDVITSCFCVDAASKNKEEYIKCVQNVRTLLKPGGYFVNVGDLNCSKFMVGNDTLTGININSPELQGVYRDHGFDIKSFKEISYEDESDDERFITFVMVAKRTD